ncbi:MAG: transglycosylase SLT domain-containing protein [bacterium]|nr:transglycosylase SLT domain-containing protein [bacterium]
MGRIRQAFASLAGERAAEVVGKILSVFLVIMVVAIVTGIVAIGYFEATAAVHAARVDSRLEILLQVVFGVVAIAVLIAVTPTLVRSVFGEAEVWWTNVFRLIALTVLVLLVAVVGRLDFGNIIRSVSGGGNGDLVGLVPDPPAGLSEDLASIRREAILERYWRILAGSDDAALIKRYEQVKRWRPLTARYASAAGLDVTKVEAIMMAESGGDPRAKSYANARGLMQLIDDNAQTYGPACGWRTASDSDDPERNICMGSAYLVDLSTRHFPNDWETSVAGYNWGIGNLSGALDRMAARFPGSPRSFWALWNKMDPSLPPTLSPERRAKNPNGYLLFNYGRNPNETRYYVPTVLAWEYIIRSFDTNGRPPYRNGHREPSSEPPLVAAGDRVPSGGGGFIPPPYLPPQPPPPPQSNVWYTARAGESFGAIVVNILREDPGVVASLNPDVVAAGLTVSSGAVIRLPEARYAFHRASGRESYRDVAARYGMATTDLLRWSGRWDDAQVRNASRRDCPPEGCEDERVLASAGEQLLVRRR